MKKTIAYIFAALTIVTAVSCTKDEQLNSNEQSGARVIELTFDNSGVSKVGVSDRTPQWEAGDQIWLSNGTNSETVTLTAANIADNVAKITTTLAGSLYAVYPASAQNGVSSGKIGFKIPTSTDGSFGKAHISVAEGTTTLAFKNVVSILKITTEDATKLVNVSSDSYISGEYKVTYSTLNIEAGTKRTKSASITSASAGDKYVAVASNVAFSALEITAVKTPTNWAYKKSTSLTTTAVNTIYPIGSVSGWTYVTDGSLWAKFSVGASTKVRFSKGNLQYQASTGTWRFASNQYDAIGNAAGNNTAAANRSTQSDWIDLFGWGATGTAHNANGQEPYSINNVATNYKTLPTAAANETLTRDNGGDWGVCMGDGWRLLTGSSSSEWSYLLTTRTNASSLMSKGVTVSGKVNCFVIAPDSYAGTIATSYTSDEWLIAELNGLVCLPITGHRNGSNVTDTSMGYYWASNGSSYANQSYRFFVGSSAAQANSTDQRHYGDAVRLIKVAE